MRTFRALAVSVLAILVLGGINNAFAAKTTIKFYTAMSVGPQTALVNAIEKRFPDVKVAWVRSGGVGMYQRFVAERMAGKGKIDILHFSYVPGWFHMIDMGILEEGAADLGDGKKYPAWAKDPKGRWIAHRVPTLWAVANKDHVKPGEEPKSWWDLTDPKWKGRIVATDPFNSAGVFDTFWAVPKVFGKKFIEEFLKNDVLIVRGMTDATKLAERGERHIALTFEYKGLPPQNHPKLKYLHMKEGVPVSPAPIAVLKDAPNKEMAKKVFAFMLSKEGQRVMVEQVRTFSAHPGLPPPEGMKPLPSYKLIKPNYRKVFEQQDEYRAFVSRRLRKR